MCVFPGLTFMDSDMIPPRPLPHTLPHEMNMFTEQPTSHDITLLWDYVVNARVKALRRTTVNLKLAL